MEGKIQMVHEDQDRSLTENGDQRGQVQCPRKGIFRGIQRQERSRSG